MNTVKIAKCDLNASEIALGCMRIAELTDQEIVTLIQTATDAGINFFDFADIYSKGQAEARFAEALNMTPSLRERMILQTKCAHRYTYYDASKEHILASVDGSLQRLRTDYIDVLLLHRPDALVEPEEVAEAFTRLEESGKVRYFGVSNYNPMQIELLAKFVKLIDDDGLLHKFRQ